ncbi:MAG: glycosyltransferase family 9 protein, partial [Nanoarchaeota archaeon]|nr:glycosyltransferase family 9 protein [Nanoarchaeota archaeon]
NTIRNFGKIPGIDLMEYTGKDILIKIRKRNFKAVIFMDLGNLHAKDFLFIPYRVSPFYPSVRSILALPHRRIFFTRKPFTPWGTHMADICIKTIECLGFKFKEKRAIFIHSKKDEENVNIFLKKNNINKFIIIHPGGKFVVETLKKGKWPPHLWPLDRYANVASHFNKKGYNILITGSKDESILADEIAKQSSVPIINCCGKLSIREVGVLLSKTRLLISTDTSIVHIAYQVETPIVELMGPSYPKVVGAWPIDSPRHHILFDTGPCAYTMKKMECPEDIICLGNITVNEVIKSSEDLLRKKFK